MALETGQRAEAVAESQSTKPIPNNRNFYLSYCSVPPPATTMSNVMSMALNQSGTRSDAARLLTSSVFPDQSYLSISGENVTGLPSLFDPPPDTANRQASSIDRIKQPRLAPQFSDLSSLYFDPGQEEAQVDPFKSQPVSSPSLDGAIGSPPWGKVSLVNGHRATLQGLLAENMQDGHRHRDNPNPPMQMPAQRPLVLGPDTLNQSDWTNFQQWDSGSDHPILMEAQNMLLQQQQQTQRLIHQQQEVAVLLGQLQLLRQHHTRQADALARTQRSEQLGMLGRLQRALGQGKAYGAMQHAMHDAHVDMVEPATSLVENNRIGAKQLAVTLPLALPGPGPSREITYQQNQPISTASQQTMSGLSPLTSNSDQSAQPKTPIDILNSNESPRRFPATGGDRQGDSVLGEASEYTLPSRTAIAPSTVSEGGLANFKPPLDEGAANLQLSAGKKDRAESSKMEKGLMSNPRGRMKKEHKQQHLRQTGTYLSERCAELERECHVLEENVARLRARLTNTPNSTAHSTPQSTHTLTPHSTP